ncbi:PadR family transcriptional regulator [Sphaerisporangium sp. NPDC088356]|uniref:PadR family transcriptional regulator n=1 Tax=Sphaerisporangium sp. NPDC088356 TaxID=3154871 RepID=UPI00341AF08D
MVRRPSRQTVVVLSALAADPATWRYGYELGQEVGLKAGSLYPILMRLCDRQLLEHAWETDAPPGRPPRHLYRLTAAGVRFAAETAPVPPHDPVKDLMKSPVKGPASPLAQAGELRSAW